MKKQKKWECSEIDYLRNNYSTTEINKILEKLSDRTKSSITNKAYLLGLDNRTTKLANLSKLLDESNEAYYWIGFLLADGHFSKNGQIQINLSIKDLEQLKKFSTFVEYKKELIKPSLYISDIKYFSEIIEKFEIHNNKTYNPPNISEINGDKLFSLIVGFIDGDGTINKKGYLCIKVHKTWNDIIDFMLSKIVDNSRYTVKINKAGLTIGTVTNIESTKKIKLKAQFLELPILKRKWDRINLKKLSKQEKSDLYKDRCFTFFNGGFNNKETIEKSGLSRSFVNKKYKEWKQMR